MNKEAAAAFIGVSVRTLQRLVKGGRVAVRYERAEGDFLTVHFFETGYRPRASDLKAATTNDWRLNSSGLPDNSYK